jgi:hypothetical protein
MSPWTVAAGLQAITLGALFFTGIAYLDARDDAVLAGAEQKHAAESAQSWAGAAKSCSDKTAQFQAAASRNAASAAKAREEAKGASDRHAALARSIERGKSAFPGDACKSADEAFNDWIERRYK